MSRLIHIIALMIILPGLTGYGLFSCGHRGESPDTGDDDTPAPPNIPNDNPIPQATSLVCPQGTALTYGNFGEAFMLEYCTSCHGRDVPLALRGGAPEDANFDRPQDASLWRALIRDVTVTKKTMPPSTHVPEGQMKQFEEWLNCGAPSGDERISSFH